MWAMRLFRSTLAAIILTAALASGCNSWERTTFQTLSSSKAVLDTAQADYESNKIPQSRCAYSMINNGKAAQDVAVNAMVEYEKLKATKGNFQAEENVVVGDLAALAPLITEAQQLISNPGTVCHLASYEVPSTVPTPGDHPEAPQM